MCECIVCGVWCMCMYVYVYGAWCMVSECMTYGECITYGMHVHVH
jgi:hypothetical protein